MGNPTPPRVPPPRNRKRRPLVEKAPESAFFADERIPLAGDKRRRLRLGAGVGLVVWLMILAGLAYGNLGSVFPIHVTAAPEAVIKAAEAANDWIATPEATLVDRRMFSYRVTLIGTDRNGLLAYVECDVLPSGEVRAVELWRGDPRSGRRLTFWLAVSGAVVCLVTIWRRRALFAAATGRHRSPPLA